MKPWLRMALLATVSAIPSAARAQPGVPITDSVVGVLAGSLREARLVFSGRVVQVGGRTTASVLAGPNNVIVEVDSGPDAVLKQPRGMRDLRARRLTVVVRDTAHLKAGDSYLWFTYGLASDSSLALGEVSRMPEEDPDSKGVLSTAVDKAADLNTDELMALALGRSSMVLLGQVDSSLAIVLPDSLARLAGGEHQFRWRRLVVTPLRTFKPTGGAPGTPVQVLRPLGTSMTRLPPLPPGTRALFFLRPANLLSARNRVGIDTTGTSFVADSIDVLPVGDTLRLKRITRSPP